MRGALRLLGRCVGFLLLLAVGTAGAVAGLLAFPGPLFAHTVAQGRLELLSDEPFDPEAGRRLLADVEARISRSPLDQRDGSHRIVVVNTAWRHRLTFLGYEGAGGLNRYPLTRTVYIRRSDIGRGLVFSPLGPPVPPPRTLTYFAAHEIAHSLTGERVGVQAYFALPHWIREGVADYVAFGSATDVEDMRRKPDLGEPSLVPGFVSPYAPFRLLVAYLLEVEGWTLERLLASGLQEAEARRMLAARYGPCAMASDCQTSPPRL